MSNYRPLVAHEILNALIDACKQDIKDPDPEGQPVKYGLGARHVQTFLYFICLSLGFIASGHMGVTIVAMTIVGNKTDAIDSEIQTKGHLGNSELIESNSENDTSVHNMNGIMDIYKTYDWPKSVQETVLGSYFFGQAIMMFPGGLIVQRWGGKVLLQFAMIVNGVALVVAPWCVPWGGYMVLSVFRFCQGASQAGLYPGINTLLSNWVPVSERTSLSSYVYAGSGIGSMLAFQIAGTLADSELQWPSTFWVIGSACIFGFILITIFGSRTPKDHKSITEAEKMFIIGQVVEQVETKAKVPWKKVLTSVPVWATMITHTGNSVTFLFFFMQVPTYMYGVLNFNIMDSGILTSLPYVGTCVSALVFGNLSDFLTNRKIISIKVARKTCNSIACLVPAACLIGVAFTKNTVFAVICFILFSTANTAMHTGWMVPMENLSTSIELPVDIPSTSHHIPMQIDSIPTQVNYMDLSPNFCGALMATGNTITDILGVILNVIISYVVTDVTNQYQWRVVMLILAGFTTIGNIIFILFMSSEIQPWNTGDDEEEIKKIED